MSADQQPTAYGRIFAPREAWLARAPAEAILEPGLAIIDTHHHLWSAPGRYLVEDLLADTASGHNVEATVFIDCRQSYRTDGPVGAASRRRSRIHRAPGGAVRRRAWPQDPRGRRHRRLRRPGARRARGARLGGPDRGGRRPLSRRAQFRRLARRSGDRQQPPRRGARPLPARRLPRRPEPADAHGAVARRAGLPPPARRPDRSGARLPGREHHREPHGHAARLRPIRGQAEGGLRAMARHSAGDRRLPERHHEARRHDDAARRLRLQRAAGAAEPRSSWRRTGAPTSSLASSCSAPAAARSRAISPSTRWASAMRPCGMRSSASPREPRPTRRSRCSAAPHGGSITSTDRAPLSSHNRARTSPGGNAQ